MSKITQKQISYIIYLLERNMPELFAKIPKNNSAHPDIRADYRRQILEDRIQNFSSNTANEIIMAIQRGDKEEVKIFIN